MWNLKGGEERVRRGLLHLALNSDNRRDRGESYIRLESHEGVWSDLGR